LSVVDEKNFIEQKIFRKFSSSVLNFNKKLSRIGRKKTQRAIVALKKLFQKNLFGKSNSLKKKTRWVLSEKWQFFDLLDPSDPSR
jgi:hypothetical protein